MMIIVGIQWISKWQSKWLTFRWKIISLLIYKSNENGIAWTPKYEVLIWTLRLDLYTNNTKFQRHSVINLKIAIYIKAVRSSSALNIQNNQVWFGVVAMQHANFKICQNEVRNGMSICRALYLNIQCAFMLNKLNNHHAVHTRIVVHIPIQIMPSTIDNKTTKSDTQQNTKPFETQNGPTCYDGLICMYRLQIENGETDEQMERKAIVMENGEEDYRKSS